METKNLEITVKLNGKEVPLSTISAGTFEMMKILEEKPKEIPVARLATCDGGPRLILRITDSIRRNIATPGIDVIAIDLANETVTNTWRKEKEVYSLRLYENIKPL